MQEKKIKELALFLPSGTGTTALYLQNALPHSTVYTTACVGKSDYLQTQWDTLDTEAKKPKILKTIKTYHFAKPYKAFYDFYDLLQKQGVEIDRKLIKLEAPIRSIGEHTLIIKLHQEVTAKVIVKVEATAESLAKASTKKEKAAKAEKVEKVEDVQEAPAEESAPVTEESDA